MSSAPNFRNLLRPLLEERSEELFEPLLQTQHFKLERIVSTGQATTAGEWLEQEEAEWVVLLAGAARLRFEDEGREIGLCPGDALWIAPRRRHRVEWTDPKCESVWLALHYSS